MVLIVNIAHAILGEAPNGHLPRDSSPGLGQSVRFVVEVPRYVPIAKLGVDAVESTPARDPKRS